ncbi:hypothetical protein Q8A64_17900 [Oxalobacteraceae bacterium R-40]|uniref:Uncharacterized protein n=1 Tax=Keguizhuia sedimenti TaxID=3064264 RepID=A0ABU1BTH4_9BURK|nr:hypothetical protein [Oxalobacteraceae bacterium R-40]
MMSRPVLPLLFLTITLSAHAVELGHVLDFGRHASVPLSALPDRLGMGIDEVLNQLSEQENRQLPRMVNAEMRLDKTVAQPGKHFIRQYTLLNGASAESNRTQFDTVIMPDLKNAMCHDQNVTMLLKNGVAVTYQYQSDDAQPIGSIELAPPACG